MAAYQSPSPTLFVNNIEGKVKKDELRQQLYSLFTPYGRIIDIITSRSGSSTSSSSGPSNGSSSSKSSARGTAFVVFSNQASATAAMRGLVGEEFYGKGLRISYAKSPSNATTLLSGGTISTPASRKAAKNKLTTSHAQDDYEKREKERLEEEERGGVGKRARGLGGDEDEEEGEGDAEGGDGADGERERKRRRLDEGAEAEDEEMEMDEDDDEDAVGPAAVAASGSNGSAAPTVLLISNLPEAADIGTIQPLFSKLSGFQSISMLPAGSTPTKSASAVFTSIELGQLAAQTLDGRELEGGAAISVVVVPAEALE